ncbi:SDR family NAD(P)-dependent oxidoreductase [Bradyrhizobium sp. Arg314]
MSTLAGRVALVTGAARGLGAAIAGALANEGASVLICDILAEAGEKTATKINRGGGKAKFIELDVSKEASWQGAIENTCSWLGKLDILINNAAVNDRCGVMASDAESWRKLFAVNLDGAFFGIRAAVPLMRRSGSGAIVNIASTAGLSGHSFAAYSASKWALRGLSRSSALELAADNIRVNTICPGLMLTEINRGQAYLDALTRTVPLRRAANVQEVASMAVYLVSKAAEYITGQDFVIDGGATAGTEISKANGE